MIYTEQELADKLEIKLATLKNQKKKYLDKYGTWMYNKDTKSFIFMEDNIEIISTKEERRRATELLRKTLVTEIDYYNKGTAISLANRVVDREPKLTSTWKVTTISKKVPENLSYLEIKSLERVWAYKEDDCNYWEFDEKTEEEWGKWLAKCLKPDVKKAKELADIRQAYKNNDISKEEYDRLCGDYVGNIGWGFIYSEWEKTHGKRPVRINVYQMNNIYWGFEDSDFNKLYRSKKVEE